MSGVPRWPVYLALGAAFVTIALKVLAYDVTGSAGLWSDAAESGVNLLAAGAAWLSLRVAARPVDPSHPYGHEKVEYFSSGLEGLLVLLAGAAGGWVGVTHLLQPRPLESLGLGAILAGVAAGVNCVVGFVLLAQGRRHRSIVLEAGGHHLLADVWTTAAVLVGLGAVELTGWLPLDGIIGTVLALWVMWTGAKLVRRSFDGLMDHAFPEGRLAEMRSVMAGELPEGVTFHGLRTRQSGVREFADFHLLVPGAWSVRRGHELAHKLEAALRVRWPALEVYAHLEPVEDASAWGDHELREFEPGNERGG